jgi:cytochrome oxidase Cu insertion factor (SCO1/SenC/PrrC family)
MQKRRVNVLAASLLAGVLGMATVAAAAAQAKPESAATSASMPKVGDMAPDFTLRYFDGNALKEVSLSQYRGKNNVVVAFFIFAFTGG